MNKLSEKLHLFSHDMTNHIAIIGMVATHIEHRKDNPDKILHWTGIIKEECKKAEIQLRKLIDTGGLEK